MTGSGKHDTNLGRITSHSPLASSPGQIRGIIKEDKSAIHAFYHQLLGLFKDALKAGGCPHCLTGHAKTTAEQCLCRLYLWAQGLDLHYLERNVEKESELQATVAGTLAGIAKIITSDLFPFGQHHKDKIDISLISSYYDGTEQSDIESDSSDSDSDDDDESTTQRHLRSLHQLNSHVTSLMDSLPTLQHSCKVEFLPISESSQSKLRVHSELPIAVRPYVLRIHDKFKMIDEVLANRLGEANWQRYLHLQALAKHIRAQASGSAESESESDDEEDEPELAHPSFVPVSEFHDSGLGASVPAKSKYAVSVASHSSFLSTQSAADRGVARVPSTPADVEEGKPFRCSICGELLENVKSRVDWKMHVFADLQPYICTFDDCRLGHVTFPSRKMWADHEFQDHRSREILRCFSCSAEFDVAQGYLDHLKEQHDFRQTTDEAQKESFLSAAKASVIQNMKDQSCRICTRTGFRAQRELISHIGRHMEEIALITLPREIDSDDEFDEEGGISVSSLEIGQDTAIPLELEAFQPSQLPQTPRNNEDAPADGDEDADEVASRIVFEIRANEITPTLEGFKDHAHKLNPRLEPYLIDRIGQEQIRRYKRLVETKVKHTNAVQMKNCPSGKHCFDLGGEATFLDLRVNSEDPGAISAQLQVGHPTDTEVDQFGFTERSIITPALFPPRIPLPPVDKFPAEFECPLCFKVKQFRKPTDWTKHVHEDIEPFTCTFAHSTEPKSFRRKADWIRHENERHRRLEWWKCDIQECAHVCYRKDNFIQHLVREHKMREPKTRRSGLGSSKNKPVNNPGSQDGEEVWRLVDSCRFETKYTPQDEPCRFCGYVCSSFRKLMVHIGKHMEEIAMPVLELVDMRQVTPDSIINPMPQPQVLPFTFYPTPTSNYMQSPGPLEASVSESPQHGFLSQQGYNSLHLVAPEMQGQGRAGESGLFIPQPPVVMARPAHMGPQDVDQRGAAVVVDERQQTGNVIPSYPK